MANLFEKNSPNEGEAVADDVVYAAEQPKWRRIEIWIDFECEDPHYVEAMRMLFERRAWDATRGRFSGPCMVQANEVESPRNG